MMRNYVRSNKTVTEEELKQVKEMDWDAYYRESLPPDMQGMATCPNCSAIILARGDGQDLTCYRCGCAIASKDSSGT